MSEDDRESPERTRKATASAWSEFHRYAKSESFGFVGTLPVLTGLHQYLNECSEVREEIR